MVLGRLKSDIGRIVTKQNGEKKKKTSKVFTVCGPVRHAHSQFLPCFMNLGTLYVLRVMISRIQLIIVVSDPDRNAPRYVEIE